MSYRKITAMFPEMVLQNVEKGLMALGVSGMTVSKVHGVGEYRNFYTKDCMTDCVRIEVFVALDQADEVANSIMRAAHQGLSSDGVVAVQPVEKFMHINEFTE